LKQTLLISLLAVAACGAPSPGRGDAGVDAGGDAGPGDAGPDVPDASVVPFVWPSLDGGSACVVPANPTLLSQTCLYLDVKARTLRPEVVTYEPAHALWADQADKDRYVVLPEGGRIDTSDMDHWQFPVGTLFFKNFGLGGKLLETRLLRRTGPKAGDFQLLGFVWRADGSDADVSINGQNDVQGTAHDVPSQKTCGKCHDGEPGKVLGFSAIQLSHQKAGPTLRTLAPSGKLTAPPPPGVDYPAPGNATEAAALGYLHANCGHCHNPLGGEAYLLVDLELRLAVAERTPAASAAVQTAVGKKTSALLNRQAQYRITKGQPDQSDLYLRMGLRSTAFPPPQMPPYASEEVDPTGRAAIAAWISAL